MEDSYIVEFIADNGCVVGEVIDTRGDLPTLMKKQFFKLLSHSDGFVLVFSIDNEDSFQYLKELCNDIQSYAYGNVPILIVSNKCDLEDNREVSTKVLSHLVDHIGCKLLNTSVRFSYVLCVCVCVCVCVIHLSHNDDTKFIGMYNSIFTHTQMYSPIASTVKKIKLP